MGEGNGSAAWLSSSLADLASMTEPAVPERIVNLPNLGFWTEERHALAIKLFAEGRSYTEIAIELHTTRNAICGRLIRAGIRRNAERVARARSYNTQKVKKMVRERGGHKLKPWQEGAEATDLPPDQADNPITITDIRDDQCRWPCSGAGLEAIFCGGTIIKGHSYCGRHCRMAYDLRATRARGIAPIWNRNGKRAA